MKKIFRYTAIFCLLILSVTVRAQNEDSAFMKKGYEGNKRFEKFSKGKFILHLSYPYINSFHITPADDGSKVNSGFMGYSGGLGYCYSDNRYLNITVSKIMDSFTPIFFVPVLKEFELMGSDYLISLSDNHVVNRFTFGYGLSFARNYWEIVNNSWEESGTGREPVRKAHSVLGFNFLSYFRVSDAFQIGIIYRPSLFRFDIEPQFKYEHSVSLDFAVKLPLGNRQQAENDGRE